MNAMTDAPAPLLFTDSAAQKVKELIDEEGNPGLKLRVFVTGGGCSAVALPVNFAVDYNDPWFVGSSSSTTVKWQTDATPSAPGRLTGAASLNFNNGTNFDDAGKQVKGAAYGKFLVDASKVTGAYLTMSFFSYGDVEALAEVLSRAEPLVRRLGELSADLAVSPLRPRLEAWLAGREERWQALERSRLELLGSLARLGEARGRLTRVAPAYGRVHPRTNESRFHAAA